MSIADASTIAASDLAAVYTTVLAAALARAAEKPAVHYVYLDWRSVSSATPGVGLSSTIVVPDDCFLEEVAVTTYDLVGANVVTVTGDNLIASISLAKTTAGGVDKFTRYFADSTVPQQLLLKGSTITVAMATGKAAGAQRVDVMLGLASARHRT